MNNVIKNREGKLEYVQGPQAVEAFRLRMLITGLRLESSGLKVSRGINCRKLAKELTGLKTNDRAVLAARLQLMLNNTVSQCLVVGEEG